jgi:hypothetical protein
VQSMCHLNEPQRCRWWHYLTLSDEIWSAPLTVDILQVWN